MTQITALRDKTFVEETKKKEDSFIIRSSLSKIDYYLHNLSLVRKEYT